MMNKNEAESVIKETIEYANNEIEKSKKKMKKEERIIRAALSFSLIAIGLTACILTRIFTSDEAFAVMTIMSIVSLICIVATWTATTLSLKNK